MALRSLSPASFPCPITELHLEHTLACGQAFRWRLDKTGWWACVVQWQAPPAPQVWGEETIDSGSVSHGPTGRERSKENSLALPPPKLGGPGGPSFPLLLRLWQDRHSVFYETSLAKGGEAFVRDYLRLSVPLPQLAHDWTRADPAFAPIVTDFAGLRVLRQDPTECLFSFLCTPAAPLYRIRAGITALCREYGDPFAGGADIGGLTHFAFPSAERLAQASVPVLQKFGLGFRAKNIREAARQVTTNGGAAWLDSLRHVPYTDAKAALMTLPGVGEKIADCVCLFSLDKDDAVPVDTHVRQAVQARYGADGAADRKTFGPKQYAVVGDTLRSRFGAYAGWASQYLFYGDLYERGAWGQWVAQWQAPESAPVRPLKP